MELLNISSNHTMFLSILIGILIINFGCIIFLVIREKKEDKREIDEILNIGREKTNKIAKEKMDVVFNKVGLGRY